MKTTIDASKQRKYEILYKQFEHAFWEMEKFMSKNRKHIESVEGDDILMECIDEWFEEISSWPKSEFHHNMCMINDTEKSERELKVAYAIENIINGLKYIGNEIDVESSVWNTFSSRIDVIDNNVDRIIKLIEDLKEQSKWANALISSPRR